MSKANKPVFEMTLVERLRDPKYMKMNWDMAGEDAARRIEQLEALVEINAEAQKRIENLENALKEIYEEVLIGDVRKVTMKTVRAALKLAEGGREE